MSASRSCADLLHQAADVVDGWTWLAAPCPTRRQGTGGDTMSRIDRTRAALSAMGIPDDIAADMTVRVLGVASRRGEPDGPWHDWLTAHVAAHGRESTLTALTHLEA